jgi:hypothetical protein
LSIFFGGGAGFLLSSLESTKSVNVLTCPFKTSISDCEEAEAESEGFSCFVTISVKFLICFRKSSTAGSAVPCIF